MTFISVKNLISELESKIEILIQENERLNNEIKNYSPDIKLISDKK
jgi:hypothetical protein